MIRKISAFLCLAIPVIFLFGCGKAAPANTVLETVGSTGHPESGISETQSPPPPGANHYINCLTFDTVADMQYKLKNDLLSENDKLNITLGGTRPENLEVETEKLRALSGLPDTYTELAVEWYGGYDYTIAYGIEASTPTVGFTPVRSEEALTSKIDALLNTSAAEPVITAYNNTENGIRYMLYSFYNKEGAFVDANLYAFCGEQSFLLMIGEDVLAQNILFSLTTTGV